MRIAQFCAAVRRSSGAARETATLSNRKVLLVGVSIAGFLGQACQRKTESTPATGDKEAFLNWRGVNIWDWSFTLPLKEGTEVKAFYCSAPSRPMAVCRFVFTEETQESSPQRKKKAIIQCYGNTDCQGKPAWEKECGTRLCVANALDDCADQFPNAGCAVVSWTSGRRGGGGGKLSECARAISQLPILGGELAIVRLVFQQGEWLIRLIEIQPKPSDYYFPPSGGSTDSHWMVSREHPIEHEKVHQDAPFGQVPSILLKGPQGEVEFDRVNALDQVALPDSLGELYLLYSPGRGS
ncbi:MAG: hypothetical protein N2170_06575 [Bacteroidia bacterium]|nr:hypothetical protein [Bacteroidia bacterium]